jgi:hypothetical protein
MPPSPSIPVSKVVASDGRADDWFGSAVAVVGDTAVIGAPNATVDGDASRGAAYVFKRIGGVWKQVQKLVASDGGAAELFGQALGVFNGKTIMIAAPFARVNGRTWQGAVYVFNLVGNRFVEKQKLTASDGTALGTFGKCIAFDGTHALFGAGGAASAAGTHVLGSVYAFTFVPSATGGSWNQVQRIAAPDPNDDTAFFGNAVALSGHTMLVGAYASAIQGRVGQGAVYVYNFFGGSWRLGDKLTATDGNGRDNFGVSIGFQGKTAFIGAPGNAVNGNISQGAVYRFDEAGSLWIEAQKLVASDGAMTNLFGASVSYSHPRVLIGAYAVNSYRGAAYVFAAASNGTWTQRRKLAASDGQPSDVYGHQTALDGNVALVPAYSADIGANSGQGAVYFYDLGPVGP